MGRGGGFGCRFPEFGAVGPGAVLALIRCRISALFFTRLGQGGAMVFGLRLRCWHQTKGPMRALIKVAPMIFLGFAEFLYGTISRV